MSVVITLHRSALAALLSVGLCMPLAAEVELDDGDEVRVDPALVLPIADDLAALGAAAQRASVPILLMYSTSDCEYCAHLESEVLGPMRLSGADPRRVIVRKVVMEEYESLRDFSGQKRNTDSYGRVQGVFVVPTVALVDGQGKDLVPKIVGYQTPGLYEKYLDQAIETSRQILEHR